MSPRPCTFCEEALHLLAVKGHVPEVQVTSDLAAAAKGAKTYPQVFYDDELVGGFDKLRDRLDEPLLSPSLARFSPVPVKHHDIWDMYKRAQSVNWVSEEIDFAQDQQEWKELGKEEQCFLKFVLSFFHSADGIVSENLMVNFLSEVQYAEARCFYAQQGYMESVHSETYGNLLASYVQDDDDFRALVTGITSLPCVKRKADWSMKWMDTSRPFAHRLLAFVCVEGIMFSGSFCAIFWMKFRGKLPSLTFSNDLIARDEGLHQQFGELLYRRHLRHKPPASMAHQIVAEAVEAELLFVEDAVGELRDAHIDTHRMQEYIRYVADRILRTIGYQPLYNARQPFPWMESISLRGCSNFFEKRNEAYVDSRVGGHDKPEFDTETADF